MIHVTKTYLPPLDEYVSYLKQIWKTNRATNQGPLLVELEQKLKDFLGVKHLIFVSNGTVALQLAIKALNLKGDILTTPFSYVATSASIVWEGCQPIYVDIDPTTLCLNPYQIEESITPNSKAIIATHVYGHPCAVEEIKTLADRHGLKVIYDAAHAFGCRYQGRSLLQYGDISTLSFHATKLFHTGEGGALITNDDRLAERVHHLKNFGHQGAEEFYGLGINGKNSEFHAALGLCVLPKVPLLIAGRQANSKLYDALLADIPLLRPKPAIETVYNYAYYPVLFPSEADLVRTVSALKSQDVYPRRYFYPSLNTLPYVKPQPMPTAEKISRTVLCLPLYPDLEREHVERICAIIRKQLRSASTKGKEQEHFTNVA